MAHEKFANEFDVAEKLVLSFEHDFLMVVSRVLLPLLFGCLLQSLETAFLEDLLKAISAVVEELFAESAEFQHTWDSFLSL